MITPNTPSVTRKIGELDTRVTSLELLPTGGGGGAPGPPGPTGPTGPTGAT